ncbi:DNA-binding CsgD family transcriptional regulator [Chitinophaga sp. OAE865]
MRFYPRSLESKPYPACHGISFIKYCCKFGEVSNTLVMSQNLYQSDTFSVEYIASLKTLKGTFFECRSSNDYTSAMRAFKEVYYKVKPARTLWDNSKFSYIISPEERKWTDEFLNAPAMQLGITKKTAIIVSGHALAMLSILDIFEEGEAPVRPGFFAYEQQALEWINQKVVQTPPPQKGGDPVITLQQHMATGRANITLDIEMSQLPEYLKCLKHVLKHHKFFEEHYVRFSSLSFQEKKILGLILKGLLNKAIGNELYISEDTVKTHRRNILRKLECHTMTDLVRYSIFL